MAKRMTQDTARRVERLRAMLEAGRAPLVDHDLLAATTATVAAAGTSAMIPIRPYEDGVIVSVEGQAFDPLGSAEVDTISERMHEKYLGVMIKVGSEPKTNDQFEPLAMFCPKRVLWVIDAQQLIEVTFSHLATSGIAALHGRISFGYVPFSLLGG